MSTRKRGGSGAEPAPVDAPAKAGGGQAGERAAAGAGPARTGEARAVPPQGLHGESGVQAAEGRVPDAPASDGNTVVPPADARASSPGRPRSTPDPTAPHSTGAIRDAAQARDPEAARAGGGRAAIGPEDERPVVGEPAEQVTAVPEEPMLLGKPPQAHEPQRPAIGESSSQAAPGAVGEHKNPIAGEQRPSVAGPAAASALPSGSRATTRPSASDDAASGVGGTRGSGSYGERPAGKVVLGPGEALPPRPAPDMSATGAAEGKNPPAPPYEGAERRVAQQDWDRWRAQDRRQRPFDYPEWRS